MGNYFKGWYFKQQNASQTLALIPAIHNGLASIQVVTEEGAHFVEYPKKDAILNKSSFFAKIGQSRFGARGIDLDISAPDISAKAKLRFFNRVKINGDIMGPFSLLPFMECRHSVFSMAHRVFGAANINGKEYTFFNGAGYIEGDRGRSFPKRYIWTQCGHGDISLMLSIADIPYMGINFRGVICSIMLKNKEIRLATYNGAKVEYLGENTAQISRGPYTFSAKLLDSRAHSLAAPVLGSMTRSINESPAARARYYLKEKGQTVFDFVSDRAGFEYEY